MWGRSSPDNVPPIYRQISCFCIFLHLDGRLVLFGKMEREVRLLPKVIPTVRSMINPGYSNSVTSSNVTFRMEI